MSDGGEIIPESRGLNGGRAARASPYHSLGANGSRFADRIPGVMSVIKFALNSLEGSRAQWRCIVGVMRFVTKCYSETYLRDTVFQVVIELHVDLSVRCALAKKIAEAIDADRLSACNPCCRTA